ncbi:MAG: molybdopterin-dependent oxidoreductase [Deltaproteobacteria bacterium]|nr:molybdopterin-dependent oxidoreductase [Deltaproteobacteria bacterium]
MEEQVFTGCTQGGPVFVHVKDGRIIRVRPMVFSEDEDRPIWTIEAKGKKFSPPNKVALAPYVLTQRARTYSENRIRYPLKRVDFDPNGDRNPETRGKSGYERISWDEALDIVADEMKRVRSTYGPEAVMSRCSSHHEWGNIGYKFSTWGRFFHLLGFTDIFDNPDSWEGWLWGAAHTYGFYWNLGVPEQYDLLEDALKNTDLIIQWSNDPDATCGVYGGQETAIWRLWLKELGKKQIYIDPYCNCTAVTTADKWIAHRPGTGAALALAIANVWIEENTYDKDYVSTHTLGFEEFQKYVTGEEDGVPKTPKWAEKITGVDLRTIKALAREWASKRTSVGTGTRGVWGGACREAYATEWARLVVLLQAMQGLGKPGVSIWGTTIGPPFNADFSFPGYASNGYGMNNLAKKPALNQVTQRIYRLMLPEAILNPPIHWLSEGFCGDSLEQQFKEYTYPEPGCSEVKMFYRYGGAYIGTMTETNRFVKMYQSPKLEFVVNQDCWWCTETGFADIILPACTNFERNDIGEWGNSGGYSHNSSNVCNRRVIVYQQKCIEPLYESKSDYQIFSELAERMGIKEDFTEGNTEEDWIEKMFYDTDLPKHTSFDDFKKKGYFVVPIPEDYKSTPALRWFYEGRECDTPDSLNPKLGTEKANELGTYSGKIEFISQSLKAHFPDDKERPPMPRYIPSWEGHTSDLAKKYPLQLLTPHPRFSFHTHHDNKVPWLGEIPGHRITKDGYEWQTIRLHPDDAEARSIKHGDIVKLFNDRGAVLGIAQVTERVMPGVVHSYESSAKYDPLEPGKAGSVDRGGCVNLLTPSRMISKNAPGMAPNSCLVEISRWEV